MNQPPMPVPRPQPLQGVTLVEADPVSGTVVLVIFDAAGQRFVFFPAEQAEQIGQQLIDHARQARTGLIVPTGGAL